MIEYYFLIFSDFIKGFLDLETALYGFIFLLILILYFKYKIYLKKHLQFIIKWSKYYYQKSVKFVIYLDHLRADFEKNHRERYLRYLRILTIIMIINIVIIFLSFITVYFSSITHKRFGDYLNQYMNYIFFLILPIGLVIWNVRKEEIEKIKKEEKEQQKQALIAAQFKEHHSLNYQLFTLNREVDIHRKYIKHIMFNINDDNRIESYKKISFGLDTIKSQFKYIEQHEQSSVQQEPDIYYSYASLVSGTLEEFLQGIELLIEYVQKHSEKLELKKELITTVFETIDLFIKESKNLYLSHEIKDRFHILLDFKHDIEILFERILDLY